MKEVIALLCLIGLAACSPPVTKTREEIEEFRSFLEKSRIDDGVLLETRMLQSPKANVWENSGKYEGDILLDDDQIEDLVSDFAGIRNRNAHIVANSRWPNAILIYAFGANEFNADQQRAILNAMSWIEHFSCVRFRRRTNERAFVTIRGQGSGCYAHVGFSSTQTGRVVNLARNTPGRGCLTHVVIIHELLHALGFQHMHQTYERNNYVRINTQNVRDGASHNFNRIARNRVSLLNLPYEFTSCMHYEAFAFSRNGQPTITALRSFPGTLGSGPRATDLDWLRLRRHYNCPGAWNANALQEMKEQVERAMPLIEMNLPAPGKIITLEGDIIDEDVNASNEQ